MTFERLRNCLQKWNSKNTIEKILETDEYNREYSSREFLRRSGDTVRRALENLSRVSNHLPGQRVDARAKKRKNCCSNPFVDPGSRIFSENIPRSSAKRVENFVKRKPSYPRGRPSSKDVSTSVRPRSSKSNVLIFKHRPLSAVGARGLKFKFKRTGELLCRRMNISCRSRLDPRPRGYRKIPESKGRRFIFPRVVISKRRVD